MNILLQIATSVLGLIVLLTILMLSQVLRQVRNVTVRRGRVAARSRSELPAHLQAAYAAGEAELRALGFVYSHCELVDPPLAAFDVHTWMLAYRHPGERCTASITAPAIPDPRMPYQITFAARYRDGTLLTTVNGQAHQIVPGMERLILVDAYAPDLAQHWQAHLEAMARLKDKGERELYESAEQSMAAHQRFLDDYVEHLQKLGALDPSGSETYRFRVFPALRLALRLLKGAIKVIGMRRRQRTAGAGLARAPATPEAEMEAYKRMEALMRRRSAGWITKTGLFAISVVLFVLAFALSLSVHTVLILVGILLFHELGHVVGMRLFGYRDVQVLFLPFLGAIALADEPAVPAYQRVIVYLLGPLPGLALGYGLLTLYHHIGNPLLYETALIALTVNYFNLLPIMPLDGGQVLNVVLFERWPRVQVVFLALSAVAAIAGGWLIGSSVLWLLAMLLVIVLASEIRKADAWSRLKTQSLPNSIDESALLQRVLAVLREPPHGRLSFPRRFHIARELLRRSRHRQATLPVAGASLAVYACALILPLWMLHAGMLFPAVVPQRAEVQLRHGNYEKAQALLEQAVAAIAHDQVTGKYMLPQAESMLGWVRLLRGDSAQARQWFLLAISHQEKTSCRPERNLGLVPLLLDLAYLHVSQGDYDAARPYVERAGRLLATAQKLSLAQYAARLRSSIPETAPQPLTWPMLRNEAHAQAVRAMLSGKPGAASPEADRASSFTPGVLSSGR